jgi:hypothetical protein
VQGPSSGGQMAGARKMPARSVLEGVVKRGCLRMAKISIMCKGASRLREPD